MKSQTNIENRYWEEALDTGNNSFQMGESPIFDTVYGFGGNGAGDDWCVQDGPFANMTNHLGPLYEISKTCLSRQFVPSYFSLGNQTYIDKCMEYDTTGMRIGAGIATRIPTHIWV
jgi:tyrosinase